MTKMTLKRSWKPWGSRRNHRGNANSGTTTRTACLTWLPLMSTRVSSPCSSSSRYSSSSSPCCSSSSHYSSSSSPLHRLLSLHYSLLPIRLTPTTPLTPHYSILPPLPIPLTPHTTPITPPPHHPLTPHPQPIYT